MVMAKNSALAGAENESSMERQAERTKENPLKSVRFQASAFGVIAAQKTASFRLVS